MDGLQLGYLVAERSMEGYSSWLLTNQWIEFDWGVRMSITNLFLNAERNLDQRVRGDGKCARQESGFEYGK